MSSPEPEPRPRIEISRWRTHEKHTLRGFFTATLPSGMIIHDLMLHQKNDQRWIGFPSREYQDPYGQKQFACFLEFRDRQTADKFRDAVLAALDRDQPWEKT